MQSNKHRFPSLNLFPQAMNQNSITNNFFTFLHHLKYFFSSFTLSQWSRKRSRIARWSWRCNFHNNTEKLVTFFYVCQNKLTNGTQNYLNFINLIDKYFKNLSILISNPANINTQYSHYSIKRKFLKIPSKVQKFEGIPKVKVSKFKTNLNSAYRIIEFIWSSSNGIFGSRIN